MAHLFCLLYVLAEHAVVLLLDHQGTHGVTVNHEQWIRQTNAMSYNSSELASQ
jgi:hypothetical protein